MGFVPLVVVVVVVIRRPGFESEADLLPLGHPLFGGTQLEEVAPGSGSGQRSRGSEMRPYAGHGKPTFCHKGQKSNHNMPS